MAAAPVWYVRNVDMLAALGERELSSLTEHANLAHFERGQEVCVSGVRHTHVFLIKEGNVRLCAHMPNGKSLTLTILQPGELIGETDLIDDSEPGMSAEALTGCTLHKIPLERLRELVVERPDVALAITKIAGQRQQRIVNLMRDVLFLTVRERMARLLLRLADEFTGTTKLGRRFVNLRLTHSDLADLIGSNREAASACLAKFKREGLAEAINGHLVLKDEEGLRTAAQSSETLV